MILALRTDKPEAELHLIANNDTTLDSELWQAHRELSDNLHERIEQLLSRNQAAFQSIDGLIIFEGPGSFTGLRIGVTVANTLSYSLDIPIIGAKGDNWLQTGLERIKSSPPTFSNIVIPKYGSPARITQPRK